MRKLLLGTVLSLSFLPGIFTPDIAFADSAFFTPVMNGAPVDFVVGNPVVGGPTANSMQDATQLGAPTYASGGCTTTPAVGAGSTPYSWTLTDGASSCTGGNVLVLTLPPAAHTWTCWATDTSNNATHSIVQSAAASTTSVTFTDYSRTAGTAQNFAASAVILGGCIAH
jgi:hypothetical protein